MTNSKKISFILFAIIFSVILKSEREPFESTYVPLQAENILIKNASVYDGDGNEFTNTDILVLSLIHI